MPADHALLTCGIRAARASDVAALIELDRNAGPQPWGAQRIARVCANSATNANAVSDTGGSQQSCLVWELEHELVGFIVFSATVDELSILALGVGQRFQQRGFGAALTQYVLHTAATAGAKRCVLELRASNTRAHRLYLRLGFAVDGLRKNYYPHSQGREDAVLMSLSLTRVTPAEAVT